MFRLALGLALGLGPAGAAPLPSKDPHEVRLRPLLVIDPGHGGANLGAAGRGQREKTFTLAIAQRLRRLLEAEGCKVVLTREDDRYLTLRERVRRTNALEPAAFLSIHANASPDHSQRGVETYVLDRQTAEIEAQRLARQAGGPVAAMLTGLGAEHQLRESLRLGRAIQDSLAASRASQPLYDRGLRQNDFDVLSGVTAPAALAELGFIDHVIEGTQLLDPAIQDELAQALSKGLLRFLRGS